MLRFATEPRLEREKVQTNCYQLLFEKLQMQLIDIIWSYSQCNGIGSIIGPDVIIFNFYERQ